MTITEAAANIGYPVIRHARERGTIKWVREERVFVLYDGKDNPEATPPEDIEFDFLQ